MSYGREPHYIYECVCRGEPDEMHDPQHPKERHVMFGCCTWPVLWTELAQFIATAHWRGELPALLEDGYALRPELARRVDLANPAPLSKPRRGPRR